MQATAQAQPNVALIKYWGKLDPARNLPATGSLSVTLDALWTRTRVAFDPTLTTDRFSLNGREDADGLGRVSQCLDRLRRLADVPQYAVVESCNNFPTGAGLASSASGFAALVAAAAHALGLALDPPALSRLARRSSGSAARSVFGGFVLLPAAVSPEDDVPAEPLLDEHAWPLEVVVAVTAQTSKTIGSTEGMRRTADTSAFYEAWVSSNGPDLSEARGAVMSRDFEALTSVSERSCLKMHGLMLSADPGLVYWNGATVECIHRIRELRRRGTGVFFTLDAGPQVKAVCLPGSTEEVSRALADTPGVMDVMVSRLGRGVHLAETP